MAMRPDGGTSKRLIGPCGLKSEWSEEALVANGRFLTRMHVDERGPGSEKAATLTFSCKYGHVSPDEGKGECERRRGAHVFKVALRLRERVSFGQGDFDCRIAGRRVEERRLGDA